MNEQLQNTLKAHAVPGWESNPAMHQIIDGYAKFHVVLAIVGAIFAVVLVALSVVSWMKFKRGAKASRFKWSFAKKVYFCFATLFTLVALFLALITAANVSNAVKPLPGFTDSISSITTNSYNVELHVAFDQWIKSGEVAPPALVKTSIDHRRGFHATRALVSGLLLVTFTVLSIQLWRSLIDRRSSSESRWTFKEAVWLVVGVITVVFALLMMLAFMANLQSVIAPIANTLQFGA